MCVCTCSGYTQTSHFIRKTSRPAHLHNYPVNQSCVRMPKFMHMQVKRFNWYLHETLDWRKMWSQWLQGVLGRPKWAELTQTTTFSKYGQQKSILFFFNHGIFSINKIIFIPSLLWTVMLLTWMLSIAQLPHDPLIAWMGMCSYLSGHWEYSSTLYHV